MVLVITVAIPCCWLAVKMRQAEKQTKAVEAIEKAGGWVFYDYQMDHSAPWKESPSPGWLAKVVGADFLSDVGAVHLMYCVIGDDMLDNHLKGLTRLEGLNLAHTQITDDALSHVKGMTTLEELNLTDTQITDDALSHLKGLTRLKLLGLPHMPVTDAGLAHLKQLENLERLSLRDIDVSEEGIEELRKALPNCQIVEVPSIPKPNLDRD